MPKINVRAFPRFIRDLKRLAKEYRSVRADVDHLVEQLSEGETPGDQIRSVGYTVYKVRIASTDTQHGKRAGYRVVYYVQTTEQLFLITIYAKSEQTDISSDEIRRIIEEELNK
ncbi:MAG: type II toxin-antitoxin system RelE/ParE family toxin [Anaerolineae bacterium]|nr:type II toxin-antitoxin system RelE/ParE family toxin [Anaerolineae bacterium]